MLKYKIGDTVVVNGYVGKTLNRDTGFLTPPFFKDIDGMEFKIGYSYLGKNFATGEERACPRYSLIGKVKTDIEYDLSDYPIDECWLSPASEAFDDIADIDFFCE